MATQNEILSDMVAHLARTEPDLDTGVGSVPRKMLDAVAEAIAERDADDILRGYSYDIDTKFGADLDEMVRLFGFSRLAARRASGEVTFSRSVPSATSILIPAGTQVTTSLSDSPIIVVSTIVGSRISPGDTSVTVPALAVDAGAWGNVAADTLVYRRTPIEGVSAVTNQLAFSGGVDVESDAALRERFKATVFRSLAGTSQMFAGIALDDPNVSHVNVLGTTKRFRERIEISSGAATSTIQNAAFIVPDSGIVGSDLPSGMLREGVHYTINYGVNPPVLTVVSSTVMPNGSFWDLEFEYVPTASRNNLASGITNRVDVWVKGERAVPATASLVFSSARQFAASGSLLNTKFWRDDETNPTVGNFFIPYPLVPLVSVSSGISAGQIVINGVTYLEDTHFRHVYDKTAFGLAPRSLAGIELTSNANGSPLADPPNNSVFSVSYVYNEVPLSVESAISDNWRLLNQDVWVHQGKLKRLQCNLAVIIESGVSQTQIEIDIEKALSGWIDMIGFNSVVQASDLLAVVRGVQGVDAAKFLTDADNPTNYAIQRVKEDGTVAQTYASGSTPKRTTDVFCGDDESPALHNVLIDFRAQNTWGAL